MKRKPEEDRPKPARQATDCPSALDRVTFIDFETTGSVPGHSSEPWQIGLVRLDAAGRVAETRESLLRVGNRPFNPYAPGNHHQVREQLAVAPTLPSLWPELRDWLEGPLLCAHNISTERSILRKAFPLFHRPRWLDTLALARSAWPDADSHALEDLAEKLGLHAAARRVLPGRLPHDALYDALCCALLLKHLLESPGWRGIPLSDLMR